MLDFANNNCILTIIVYIAKKIGKNKLIYQSVFHETFEKKFGKSALFF